MAVSSIDDTTIYTYTALPCEEQTDTDRDGVGDGCDNCPFVSNPNQNDMEGDGVGDLCDNCMYGFNPGQEDDDGDAIGNFCDHDNDYDGVGEYRVYIYTYVHLYDITSQCTDFLIFTQLISWITVCMSQMAIREIVIEMVWEIYVITVHAKKIPVRLTMMVMV